MDISEYAQEMLQETLAAAEADGIPRLEAFTELVIDRLAVAGEFEDAAVAYLKKTGLEISGWSLDPEDRVLHAFVTDWSGETPPRPLAPAAALASLRRLASFLAKCVDGYASRLEESTPVWELADLIPRQVTALREFRLYLFSDSVARRPPLPVFEPIAGVPVTPNIWDLERLYRLDTSGLEREAITVDVAGMVGRPLPCLAAASAADHNVYLAVLPGRFLADLYDLFGARLLERNVRAFLQARGLVNRGIRETLARKPDRFLAYNNGISATAANARVVELPQGGIGLTEITDLQIVNGGQTTASIHHARSRDRADLSEVRVQLKLTVVRPDLIDQFVPSISRFSNTQNKVTGADFSANDPFHIRLEELSRTIWAPAPDGVQRQTRWFYERARGQYGDAVVRAGTPAKQRQFKVMCPPVQKFTKTDLAKFHNTWDQQPHIVSLGGEKNFRQFMIGIAEGRTEPDADWFQRLVAKAILFRRAERIVQQQRFGGYRAQVVTYTLAKLVHATESRIDLTAVWRQQRPSAATESAIADLCHPVHEVLTRPSGPVRHIGEWCKKLECWKAVTELAWTVPTALATEIGQSGRRVVGVVATGTSADATPEERSLIAGVAGVPGETWFGIARWAKETGNLQGWQRGIAFSLGQLLDRGRLPSVKQARQAGILYDEALRLGYPAPPIGTVGEVESTG